MNHQVFYEISHCWLQSVVMCCNKAESQASYVGLLSGLGNRCLNISCEGLDRNVLPRVLVPQVMLKMYVSHVPDSRAWETDALNVSWKGLVSYVFCPVTLIPQVFQQMTTYRCRIIMIAPGVARDVLVSGESV